MKENVKLSHRLEHAAVLAVAHTIGYLPIDLGTGLGASIARGAARLKALRKRADRNLAFAIPDLDADSRRKISIEMLDGLTRTLLEYRFLKTLFTEEDRIEIEGVEHLKAAQAAGKGAVLATGHFGNWEIIRLAFAQQGWPPALIYRQFNNPLFDAYSRNLMSIVDAPLFHKGRRGALGMMRHVRGGGAALILTDQRFSRAPEIPFFGKPAKTSLGSAEIALNYGAALLPVRGERLGRSSRFRVVIEPPCAVENRTPEEVMTEINSQVEAWARAKPEQYFWMHNRWGKVQAPPKGEDA